MQIDIFEEFATLAIHENYSSAAQELHVSQPTLSRHIAALEKEVGCDLIASLKPFRLTPAGKAVFSAATQINDIVKNMNEFIREISAASDQTVRIDARAINSFQMVLFSALDDTMNLRPSAQFNLVRPAAGLTPQEAVRQGSCDISFTFRKVKGKPGTEPFVVEDGLSARNVPAACGPLLFAVPHDSPIASLPEVRLEDMRNETFMTFADKAHADARTSFAALLEERGIEPRFRSIPVDTYEEFYLRSRKDGVLCLYDNPHQLNSDITKTVVERTTVVPLAPEEDIWMATQVLYPPELLENDSARLFIETLARIGN